MSGLFNSRGSTPSTTYCKVKSHFPLPTASPKRFLKSISFERNAEGKRTLRSSCFPFNERNSAVYRLVPMSAVAFP